MTHKPNELLTRIAKAIHRYDYDHDLSRNDIPSVHHRGEAAAVLATIQDAYVPPPPGSNRDQLPAHLVAVIDTAPYLSTGCQVAQALEAAAHRNPELANELQEWARRKHASCRLNNKSTGQLCICAHHPERIAATTDQPPDRP